MSQSQHKYRVIISGGGTGGHIYPAIAVANELKARGDVDLLFVGALGRMEMEKVPKAGYAIEGLPIAGLQRRLTLKNLLVPFKLIASLMKAKKLVKKFAPDIAVGFGGYASAPVLKVSAGQGVKTMLQEQNSYAGMTNRLLAKKAKKICVAYEGMQKYFPESDIKLTGNPVRRDILDVSAKRDEARKQFGLDDRPVVLIVGGSLGAGTINKSIGAGMETLKSAGVQVLWQTGAYYYDSSSKEAEGFDNAHAHAFIYEMDLAYAAADIVISRAGALSISELCLVGKPVILVPSPNVAEDHQTKNAMALVDQGAAHLVKDVDAGETLVKSAIELLSNKEKCASLSENIAKMGRPNAAEEIASEVMKLIEN